MLPVKSQEYLPRDACLHCVYPIREQNAIRGLGGCENANRKGLPFCLPPEINVNREASCNQMLDGIPLPRSCPEMRGQSYGPDFPLPCREIGRGQADIFLSLNHRDCQHGGQGFRERINRDFIRVPLPEPDDRPYCRSNYPGSCPGLNAQDCPLPEFQQGKRHPEYEYRCPRAMPCAMNPRHVIPGMN